MLVVVAVAAGAVGTGSAATSSLELMTGMGHDPQLLGSPLNDVLTPFVQSASGT